MSREWTERHIREIIEDELKNIKKGNPTIIIPCFSVATANNLDGSKLTGITVEVTNHKRTNTGWNNSYQVTILHTAVNQNSAVIPIGGIPDLTTYENIWKDGDGNSYLNCSLAYVLSAGTKFNFSGGEEYVNPYSNRIGLYNWSSWEQSNGSLIFGFNKTGSSIPYEQYGDIFTFNYIT